MKSEANMKKEDSVLLSRWLVGANPPPQGEQPARSRHKGCWVALMLVGVLSEVKRPVLEGRCCGCVRNEMKVPGKQTGFIVGGGVAEGGCWAGSEWTGHRSRNSPTWVTQGSAK